MKNTFIATVLFVGACFSSTNHAMEVVKFGDPGSMCVPGMTGKDFQSAQCTLSNGRKVYITLNSQGLTLNPLNDAPSMPKAVDGTHVPVTPPNTPPAAMPKAP